MSMLSRAMSAPLRGNPRVAAVPSSNPGDHSSWMYRLRRSPSAQFFNPNKRLGKPGVLNSGRCSCQFEHLFVRVVGLQHSLGMTLVDALERRDQAEKRCFRLSK